MNFKYPVFSFIQSTTLIIATIVVLLSVFIFSYNHGEKLSTKATPKNVNIVSKHDLASTNLNELTTFSYTRPQIFTKSEMNKLPTNQFINTLSGKNNCDGKSLFVSHDETAIYAEPSELSPKLITVYGNEFLIDPRYNLVIIDKSDQWTKVKAISPKWPPDNYKWSGWIKNSDIYNYKSTDDERLCLFVDFSSWAAPADRLIQDAKDMARKILSTDKRCNRIVNAGYIGSGQRFFLSCHPNDGGKSYHYWFSLLKKPKIIQDSLPVSENIAFSACRQQLQTAHNNMIRIKHFRDQFTLDEEIDQFVNVSASTSEVFDAVWRITLTYLEGSSSERKAYCFVGPNGLAEISFPVQFQIN